MYHVQYMLGYIILLPHVCKMLSFVVVLMEWAEIYIMFNQKCQCACTYTQAQVYDRVVGKFTAAAMLIILGFLDCTVWPLAMTVLIIGNAVCVNIIAAFDSDDLYIL